MIRIFIAVMLLSAHCNAAEIETRGRIDWSITVTGPIIAGDEGKLKQILQKDPNITRSTHFLNVTSEGGDVEAAIKMGRMIRDAEMFVVVPRYCRSACVFLLIGAANRVVIGDVAIHRPYFAELSPSLSTKEVDARYKRLVREVYDYLTEMNVPTILADTMFSIPPNEKHSLTIAELSSYMLDKADPAYLERWMARSAAQAGLSLPVFRQRKSVFDTVSGSLPLNKFQDCQQAVIMEGRDPNIDPRCRIN
jgi:hypothetical protein